MLEQYEQNILRGYLRNFFLETVPPKQAMSAMCDWVEENFDIISDQDPGEDFFDQLSQYQSAVKNHSGIRYCQTRIVSEMANILEIKKSEKDLQLGQVEKNLRLLGDELKLNQIDCEIFGFIARYTTNSLFEYLVDRLSHNEIPAQLSISLFLGLDRNLISERLSVGRPLVSSGLIRLQTHSGKNITDRFDLPEQISSALQKISDNQDSIHTHILGSPEIPSLEWDDFSHLEKIRDKLALFLEKSTKDNLSGINILLWGPPGTGKTEFCKTLAQKLDCNLYAVGETDDDGEEPSRKERLEALRLAQSLLRYQPQNLLMFDEMDDLFDPSSVAHFVGAAPRSPSKVFTNRLFEKNYVPTIWIINDVTSLDETIIRRMSLVLEIKSPPARSREAVWNRIARKHQLDLPARDMDELAKLEIAPAVLDSAVRFAQITGNGHEDVLFASRGIIKAIKGNIKQDKELSSCYRSELLNADMDLNALGQRLQSSKQNQFSLCLYGLPGTGKTEYIRQLAKQLGMEVLVKRSSDLLGSYVGETERAIASAFQEAIENESFLIFDEADSLLGDRRYAHKNWEISQVNEMLTWMESHPFPFACTTNLMDRLDQASLRRFTFKVGFSPLTQDQNRIAFEEFFGISAPEAISALSNLTPGDFTVVHKKAAIMGVLDQPEEIIAMLSSESSVKESLGNQIGFAM